MTHASWHKNNGHLHGFRGKQRGGCDCLCVVWLSGGSARRQQSGCVTSHTPLAITAAREQRSVFERSAGLFNLRRQLWLVSALWFKEFIDHRDPHHFQQSGLRLCRYTHATGGTVPEVGGPTAHKRGETKKDTSSSFHRRTAQTFSRPTQAVFFASASRVGKGFDPENRAGRSWQGSSSPCLRACRPASSSSTRRRSPLWTTRRGVRCRSGS